MGTKEVFLQHRNKIIRIESLSDLFDFEYNTHHRVTTIKEQAVMCMLHLSLGVHTSEYPQTFQESK